MHHLLLGHYSSRYKDLEPLLDEARTEFPESVLGRDGMILTLGKDHSLKIEEK